MIDRTAATGLPELVHYDDTKVDHAMRNGVMNTEEEILLNNVGYSIRQGHQQWCPGPMRPERVCLVGSGPSLKDTEEELRQLVWEGAILVTLNGAYHWCIDHGLRPQTQIVMDARPSNARFVMPAVPRCNYVIASQCAPSMWANLVNRPHTWIFHAVTRSEDAMTDVLDTYYLKKWIPVGGGTTAATRAINLLRIAGYLRYDLFGIDCCWFGNTHHAMPQPENEKDTCLTVKIGAQGRPDTMREFRCSPWQLKQAEDLMTIMYVNGKHFMLTSHGDGMFTHLLQIFGEGPLTIEKE